MILYYTGTGNSRYAAEYLAHALGDELINSFEYIRQGTGPAFTSERPWVFAFPAYAWRIPRVFEAFLDRCTFHGCKKAYFVMTCGGGIGDAGRHLKKLCARWGLEYMGVKAVVMPENYLAMFPVPTEKQSAVIRRTAHWTLEKIAGAIEAGDPVGGDTVGLAGWCQTWLVNRPFYAFCVKARAFRADDKCIGCGECVRRCPLGNVELVKGKPQWGKNCTHCMACICYCPTEAIEYGRESRDKYRYKCPDYKPNGKKDSVDE